MKATTVLNAYGHARADLMYAQFGIMEGHDLEEMEKLETRRRRQQCRFRQWLEKKLEDGAK